MSFTIGIDAGGTKTTGLILDSEKNILFQTETGYGNPNVDFDQALSNVWEAVYACLASEYGENCTAIAAGVAGIEAEGNRQRFEDFFATKTDLPVVFVNDAVLAYYALLDGEDGILTIAGQVRFLTVKIRKRKAMQVAGDTYLVTQAALMILLLRFVSK